MEESEPPDEPGDDQPEISMHAISEMQGMTQITNLRMRPGVWLPIFQSFIYFPTKWKCQSVIPMSM